MYMCISYIIIKKKKFLIIYCSDMVSIPNVKFISFGIVRFYNSFSQLFRSISENFYEL